MHAFRHNADSCFGQHGVEKAEVKTILARLGTVQKELASGKNKAAAALLALPSKNSDLPEIEILASELRAKYKHVVIVGAGGSSLSGRTLSEFKPNNMLHFLENIDPDAINALLSAIDISKSCFIIISKSGTTVETLAQFYVLLELVKQKAKSPSERFIIITMPGNNPLRNAAEEYGMRILDHDADIGGRFSIFTNVGLLPGAIIGLNIKSLRRGAAATVKQLGDEHCLPALGAALQYALLQKNHNISVMLPYAQRLSGFSSWYRQCWAESLGKSGKGSTPIRAVGTTDQHSQLQLYLGGPKDKLFHLITVKRAGSGQKVHSPDAPELSYMQNKTTGDIMAAQQKATYETLVSHGRPVRLFELDRLGEEELGALIMHFMLEIIFMAHLLSVDPFDQPAVEDGKKRAREYLLSGKL